MSTRVKVIFEDGAYRVDLPSYQMVPGSFLPLIPGIVDRDGVLTPDPDVTNWDGDPDDPRLNSVSCLVELAEDESDLLTGRPDFDKIRQTHRNHSKWGRADYTPDI